MIGCGSDWLRRLGSIDGGRSEWTDDAGVVLLSATSSEF